MRTFCAPNALRCRTFPVCTKRRGDWVEASGRISLASQVVLGLFSLVGFAASRPWQPLFTTLFLDVFVQVVEVVYYTGVVFFYPRPPTYMRYADWFVSTPIMMTGSMIFNAFLGNRQLTVGGYIEVHGGATLVVVALNAAMLAFGLAAELKVLPVPRAVACGTAAFLAEYAFVYATVPTTNWGYIILSGQAFIWSLYGVAALLPYAPKNVMYNGLDVLAKNAYGVILVFASFVLEQ
jgi:bacteriorhodopsin